MTFEIEELVIMYVCLCKKVTCSQIRSVVTEGRACNLRELSQCLGVATQCGKCGKCARGVLEETLDSQIDMQSDCIPQAC